MRPIPPLVLAATLATSWGIAHLDPTTAPTRIGGLSGLAIALAGVGVTVAGIAAFRRHRTTVDPRHPERASTLVTGGVFAVTRNPMYVGMMGVAIGSAIATGARGALVPPIAFLLWLDRVQIPAEERALHARFGADFGRSAARTRRWLGRRPAASRETLRRQELP